MGSAHYGSTTFLNFYIHVTPNNLSNARAKLCWLYCCIYFTHFNGLSFNSKTKKIWPREHLSELYKD